MHLAYAARLIKRRLPAVLVAALLGLAVGLFLAHSSQAYTSTAYLSLSPSQDQQSVRAVSPERFFQTESQLVLSDQVMDAAAKELTDGTSPEALREVVTLGGGATNDVLQLQVDGSTPQESQQRTAAVLSGLQKAKLSGISTRLLWTTAPAAALDTKQYAVGGLLGGALLGALACVVAGAVRRPLLDARYAQVDGVEIYPRTLAVGEPTGGDSALGTWLRVHNPGHKPVVAVPVGSSPTAATTAAHLSSPSPVTDPEAGRLLVYVAPVGTAHEGDVEAEHRSRAGQADSSALVLVDTGTGTSTGNLRRGAVTTETQDKR